MNPRRAAPWIHAGIGALPLIWLLAPGLLAREQVTGMQNGSIYAALYRLQGAVESLPATGFPGVAEADVPLRSWLLAPLTAASGAALSWEIYLIGMGALCWLVAWRATAGLDGWLRSGCVALLTATPAALAGLTVADPEALGGWVALLPWLPPAWSVPLGLAGGVVAPGHLPAALLMGAIWIAEAARGHAPGSADAGIALPAALQARLSPRVIARLSPRVIAALWQVGASLLALLPGALLAGLPTAPAPEATWFGRAPLEPIQTTIPTIFLGFLPPILLLIAAWTGGLARDRAILAALIFVAAALPPPLSLPVDPAWLLALIPLLALRALDPVLRALPPATAATCAVLAGVAMLGEGWKGSTAAVPLALASVRVPAPILQIHDGPVLDLPAGGGASGIALWYQLHHRQVIASTPSGRVDGAVWPLEAALQGVTAPGAEAACPDLAAPGFRAVILRREHAFREPATALRCLGPPTHDDGRVAVWLLPAKEAP